MAPTRRAFLATATGSLAVTLAGCSTSTDGSGGGSGDGGGDGSGSGDETTAAGTATAAGGGGEASGDEMNDGGGGTDADGGTDSDGGGGTETTTEHTHSEKDEETAAESGTSAREAYPDFNWGNLDGASPETTDRVALENFSFNPMVTKVPPGTTVTFTNKDGAPHTVTIPALGVDEQLDGDGGTATVTFEETGEFGMVCTFHPPDMLGQVVVEEGATINGDAGGDSGDAGEQTTTDDGYDDDY